VSAHRGRMCRGIVDASSLRLVVPGRIKRELPPRSPRVQTVPFADNHFRHGLRICHVQGPDRRLDVGGETGKHQ
jgi:hypothetical protein